MSLIRRVLKAYALLSICTGSLAAQSERSRQRSGPIKSVPVAANIKRDADFDCPEEFGYYPHPTDCTLYYVCVFGGALLESCTGGLMYSHELQTCDWPRNVGCDANGASAAGGDVARYSDIEREPAPPPPPPRRAPPPPPPRAQPNPVVTSRGQPKITREEYIKQQQLYAEIDDLPPVEEIESDRQQRVYRGQPSTIGQVQRDRDGYSSQINTGRNLNSNIIPASINQGNGKIGSFSFGTQVDERRSASVTQAPQTYSVDTLDVTDSFDECDTKTNKIDVKNSRKKREVIENVLENAHTKVNNATEFNLKNISRSSGFFKDEDLVENQSESGEDEYADDNSDDVERGKRQIRNGRYIVNKNGNKNTGGKLRASYKHQEHNAQGLNVRPFHSSVHNYQQSIFNFPSDFENFNSPFVYTTKENIIQYPDFSQIPFKPSLPDPYKERPAHAPMNIATQIITKSPPISSLIKNNPFLAGGFFNNIQSQKLYNNQQSQISPSKGNRSPVHTHEDSDFVPTTVVTNKPVLLRTPLPRNKYNLNHRTKNEDINKQHEDSNIPVKNEMLVKRRPPMNKNKDYENKPPEELSEEDDSEEDSSEEEEPNDNNKDDHFKHDFPEPPYEFTHPSNKYADIKNPFADPKFDFDAFLSKLRNDHLSAIGISEQPAKQEALKTSSPKLEIITSTPNVQNFESSTTGSTLNYYKGMSTPRPFTVPTKSVISWLAKNNNHSEKESMVKTPVTESYYQQSVQTQPQYIEKYFEKHNVIAIQTSPQNAERNNNFDQINLPSLSTSKPQIKYPDNKSNSQLPLNFDKFEGTLDGILRPPPQSNYNNENYPQHTFYQSIPKQYLVTTANPIALPTPNNQEIYNSQKIITPRPQASVTANPYLFPSTSSLNGNLIFQQYTTSNPIKSNIYFSTTALTPYKVVLNNQLISSIKPSVNPNYVLVSQSPKNIFTSTYSPINQSQPSSSSTKLNLNHIRGSTTSTTLAPPKRRPIPKPSPEMNDYYYDEYDQYYEPAVKSKYMPSSEVKPQRPLIAQNYQEYEDDSYEDDSSENKPHNKKINSKQPGQYENYRIHVSTKQYNDIPLVTKAPYNTIIKNKINGKIPIPVLVDYGTPTPSTIPKPEVSNYEVFRFHPNRTVHLKRPISHASGPNTVKPPKYLNDSTLRPYTVRHRLGKPTTPKTVTNDDKETKTFRGRTKLNHNTPTTFKLTTSHDSHNQETRLTKTRHDDRTNSLEPTESITPVSYSASPRPKMLYNGSQNYSPDQYDPYYAIYDEDGELYKDTDYVQQYNTASLRPAVQQTYRGTPPPARRPVQTYTPRPVSADDYDDALIQGQINTQNQYQTAVRQSTRGEGNELGYDHNPTSVRTTLYEATSISTTPSTTTSTSTTTQRPTTAPFTEAMTPSRYTQRSSTDANQVHDPDYRSLPFPNTSPKSLLNISSFAKPFEKTNNSMRLQDNIIPIIDRTDFSYSQGISSLNYTQRQPHSFDSGTENKTRESDKNHIVSLTTGFSIRRDSNDDKNNTYTLTVITRPFENFHRRNSSSEDPKTNRQTKVNRYYYSTEDTTFERTPEKRRDKTMIESEDKPVELSHRRKTNSRGKNINEEERNLLLREYPRQSNKNDQRNNKIRRVKNYTTTTISNTPINNPSTQKYYLKTVIKRPSPFSLIDEADQETSTENNINTNTLIEKALQNVHNIEFSHYEDKKEFVKKMNPAEELNSAKNPIHESELAIPSYKSLNNMKSDFKTRKESTDFSTNKLINVPPFVDENDTKTMTTPSHLKNERNYDDTTEVFSKITKRLFNVFFNNLENSTRHVVSPTTRIYTTTTTSTSTTTATEPTVNIAYTKKESKYDENYNTKVNFRPLQVETEKYFKEETVLPYYNRDTDLKFNEKVEHPYNFENFSTNKSNNLIVPYESESIKKLEIDINKPQYSDITEKNHETFLEKKQAINESSDVIDQNLNDKDIDVSYNKIDSEQVKTVSIASTTKLTDFLHVNDYDYEDYDTTTKATRPLTIEHTTSSTTTTTTTTEKSISFPIRPSRVNPAIKLAAAYPGGGRRSYQSSKCSSDNSLQANPKCNEIKYQRPTTTRGRGSAHYSVASEAPLQQNVGNRGTPPIRNRPTLKPSTAIVSKATEFVDIYAYPPRRPPPVYPQPTPDKTAAKCRKDVCLLPDCYCGGKEIPGDMPVESVPQIVLLTFDDSVNDLNKGLYTDLFEKGRVNPNGCPIAATFYVSHEWTDYSQVQNLYAAGHEMASHTISHSFGEQFSQKKWNREVGGQREILSAYGGVKLEDVRGMRAPFLSVGGNKMFKMLYDSNFTYDSSMPVYENKPPSWPYTLDYKLFHDCMIPPCPTRSYPGVWEVPMVMWQDLNGGRCSMGDACANPPNAEGVYKMILKNFDRHYTSNRAPFGLYYHAAWFTQPHHKEGFIMFLDTINRMPDVWLVTNWQALQWVRDPTPISRMNSFQPFQCNYPDRPKKCNNPKVCNLWHKSGVRYMRTCQPCPEVYPWTGKTGIRSSRIDNDIEE